MLGQGPDKVQATFNDASVCFSEEEWMILKEWQKELYRNVMNEIHQALLSLGPLIVTTVFSLRTKDKEGLGIPGCQEAESIQDGAPASMFTDDLGAEVRRRSLDPDPGEGICNREELINRNKEETLNSEITWKTERRERKDCLSTGYEMILSCIKEDAAAYSCAVDQNSERQQNPSTSTGFCIKEDEATYCNDEQDSARQHSASISQGHGVITTINTLYDKDEADNYSMEHNEAGIGDRAWSPAGSPATL
ncbi:zinc finger protein 777-like isoform X3 [Ambystoma mexicanum]|uniref:zinc finger protein 777-like isoform X3 n=1 Tax=Ambystoma mexicanum TaxID=8296 RepID=UPI0037E70711